MGKHLLFEGHHDPLSHGEGILGEGEGTPPSPLAEYVIAQMPHDLDRVLREETMTYEELAAQHSALLQELQPAIAANTDPDVAKTTQLDLHFMFGGYIPQGKLMYQAAPPELMPLINHQADRFEGLDKYMSYDLIIDHNAAEYAKTGQIRVYSSGDLGRQERDFYIGHSVAEPFVRNAAYLVHGLVENPGLHDAGDVFEQTTANLTEFRSHMGTYGRLSVDGFKQFRAHLAEYADGTRNASGAFMPSVQLLELGLHAPTELYGKFLDASMPYFPRWAKPVLEDWRSLSTSGENVTDLVDQGVLRLDDRSKAGLLTTIDRFIGFRLQHVGITQIQIPEPFSGMPRVDRKYVEKDLEEKEFMFAEQRGSAGFDPRELLVNSVRRMIALSNRVEDMSVPHYNV